MKERYFIYCDTNLVSCRSWADTGPLVYSRRCDTGAVSCVAHIYRHDNTPMSEKRRHWLPEYELVRRVAPTVTITHPADNLLTISHFT